jgi:hypothetical protein
MCPGRIRIKSSTGVPGWYGRIVSARWSAPEWISIRCKSAETILQKYVVVVTPTSKYHEHQTTGVFIKTLLEDALVHGKTGFSIGNIDLSGPLVNIESRAEDFWDDLIPWLRDGTRQLNTPTDNRYCAWIDEYGAFHWQPQRGQDRRSTVNLYVGPGGVGYVGSSFGIDWDGVISYVVGLGNVSNWDEKARYDRADADKTSRFGVRDALYDAGVNTTDRIAAGIDSVFRGETKTLDVTITNEDRAWSQFWVGDIIRISCPQYGWSESGGVEYDAIVTGLEIQEEAERMRIIGKEWLGW